MRSGASSGRSAGAREPDHVPGRTVTRHPVAAVRGCLEHEGNGLEARHEIEYPFAAGFGDGQNTVRFDGEIPPGLTISKRVPEMRRTGSPVADTMGTTRSGRVSPVAEAVSVMAKPASVKR